MAERVLTDVGLMQREATSFFPDDPKDAEALRVALESWIEALPASEPGDWSFDGERRTIAELFRSLLASIGLDDDGMGALDTGRLRKKGLREDTSYWLAAQWLAAYNGLMKARTRFADGDLSPENMGAMIYHSERLGCFRERMWWRCGIDPQTGKRREQLALGKRNQHAAIPKAIEKRRTQAQDTKPDWHDDATIEAKELRAKFPTYSRWRISGEIHKKHNVTRGRCDKVLKENGID